ncbi:MAG: efflux RND transporter permease subunit [Planctomycetes bacterium]|nr:efflux RND transporter permease subunit [Planctomycetota bacterium]
MFLSDLSVNRSVMAAMVILAILVFGAIGYTRLGISQYPDVEFPVVSVTTVLEGAAPEVVELDVTDVLEEEINTIEGIRSLRSVSALGFSRIEVEFELERDIDVAVQDVRDKVGMARRELPEDIDPPIVQKENPADQPIMWLAVYGQRPIQEVTSFADDYLRPRLETIKGVGSVLVGGKRERMIRVWIQREWLEAHRLAADDVMAALARENIEVPGGNLESEAIEFQIKTEGEVPEPAAFGDVIVAYRDGAPIRIRDVALVEDGLEDERGVARYNQIPAVGLGVRKQRGANTVAIAREVRRRLEELRPTFPADFRVTVAYDGSRFIEDAIREIEFALIVAVALTAVVTFVFLISFGSTLIIFLAIPTSLVGTFAVMYFMDFTLNTFTLLGLNLSVGLVVDDAIIVLENIYRHREMGQGPAEGAKRGAGEIAFAALAATLSIAAVFVPVAFLYGVVGQFFYEFGITIAAAILISLFVALTLTPMLCSKILRVGKAAGPLARGLRATMDLLSKAYETILRGALRIRFVVIAVSIALLIGSFGLLGRLGKEFVPPQDVETVLLLLDTPVGSSIEYTNDKLRLCETWFSKRTEVRGFFAAIGIGFEQGVNHAVMFVSLTPVGTRKVSQQELTRLAREELGKIPGMQVLFLDLSQAAFSARAGFPIEFNVQGPDLAELERLSGSIMDGMRGIPGVVDIDSDFDRGQPEVRVVPDRDRAADAGVTVAQIGRAVGVLAGGVEATKYKEGGKRYEVRVRMLRAERETPASLREIALRGRDGRLIRLGEVAAVREVGGLPVIRRLNRERTIGIQAGLAEGTPQAAAIDGVRALLRDALKDPYRASFTGTAEEFQRTFVSLIFALGLAILFTYMVLASQFNSLIDPFVVMMAVPFSLIGAAGSLYAAGQTLNLYSFIGLILLQGLVVKNSILLVEFANHERERGAGAVDAMLRAGRTRLRPILMTAISTIFGAVPVVVLSGAGAETRRPMGVAVLGGMTVSTLLSLLVVPAVYVVIEGIRDRFRGSGRPGSSSPS